MNILIKKITVGLTTVGVLVTVMAPAVLAGPNTIDGNGVFSKNTIKNNSNCVAWLSQKSKTGVVTVVAQKGRTGKNSNLFNTGGTQSTTTGGVTNGTTVTAIAGSNDGTLVDPCCPCQEASGDNTISNNGAFSNNKITDNSNSVTGVSQKNTMNVVTVVNQTGTTGGNSSSFNTGSGSTIDTGTVDNSTDVLVTGGSNTASL